MTESYRSARKTISKAITLLEKAEDNASGTQQMVLLDLIEILRKERIKIDAKGLADSGEAYVAATRGIKQAAKKLEALTKEIEQLIKRAEKAAKVTGTLAKLVGLAAKVAA